MDRLTPDCSELCCQCQIQTNHATYSARSDHAFNKGGIEGLVNDTSPGRPCKLSRQQKASLKAIVEHGPDPTRDGVVRWRCIDLVRLLERKFGISVSEDTIARTLRTLGFTHISARPKHPEQKKDAIAGFEKKSTASSNGR